MLISTVSTWNTKAMRRLFKNSITYNIVDFVLLCCLKLQSLVLTLVVNVLLIQFSYFVIIFPRPLVPQLQEPISGFVFRLGYRGIMHELRFFSFL